MLECNKNPNTCTRFEFTDFGPMCRISEQSSAARAYSGCPYAGKCKITDPRTTLEGQTEMLRKCLPDKFDSVRIGFCTKILCENCLLGHPKRKEIENLTYGDCRNYAIRKVSGEGENKIDKEESTQEPNDGWITGRLPEEKPQKTTINGQDKEWTESDMVLAWDSMYGPMIDYTINGKWKSESNKGFDIQAVHGIVAWRPIPPFKEI